MVDLLFLAVIAALAATSWALIALCDGLMGDHS